jgi:DNA invertase Pin-like site-specific DNA recombinase
MVAAYIRVSSKSQNMAMQTHAINRAARTRRDKVTSWYVDRASGVAARPKFEQLRNDLRGGRVAKLYVYRLDRLSRRGIVEVVSFVRECKQYGVELVTIADGFILEGDAAEVVIAVLSWAAQMERNAINERIASARQRVEAEGGSWGRPSRLDDVTRARIRRMQTKDGLSVREIAVALKIPRATVGRALKAG